MTIMSNPAPPGRVTLMVISSTELLMPFSVKYCAEHRQIRSYADSVIISLDTEFSMQVMTSVFIEICCMNT